MDTVKSNTLGIGEALMRLIHEAIGRGLAVRQGGDPITPFLLSQPLTGVGPMMVLATQTHDEAVATARYVVARGGAAYYALVYDGFITDVGAGVPRTEAIHVEAYDRGAGRGMRFAQRYQAVGAGQPFGPIGNPMYLDELPLPTVAEYGPKVEGYERERAARGMEER